MYGAALVLLRALMTSFAEKKARTLSVIGQLCSRIVASSAHTVARKGINSSKDRLEINVIVRSVKRLDALSVQRNARCVDIEREVDARIVQHLHSLVVVFAVIDVINPDGIDAKFLEVFEIVAEGVHVKHRIRCARGASGLVCNTTNVETVSIRCPEGIAFRCDSRELATILARENL